MSENKTLHVDEAKVAERMLFNPLLEKSRIYVFDSVDGDIAVYENVAHCIKDVAVIGDELFIIPEKSSNANYLKRGAEIEDTVFKYRRSYTDNMNLWSNKNVMFDYKYAKEHSDPISNEVLTITESNKLRGSIVTSSLKIEGFRFVVVFVSEILFKSPICCVKTEKGLDYLLNNLERWLTPGYDIAKRYHSEDEFVFGKESVTVNGQEMQITDVAKNISNIADASKNEIITVNEYGEVVRYHNEETGITMQLSEDENGSIVTEIFIDDDILIYKTVEDGYERRSLCDEEFLQSLVEQGIYRRDPEENIYYIDDAEGNRVISIIILKDRFELIGPGPEGQEKFRAIVDNQSMTFLSHSISVSQNKNVYIDTFTFADNGVVYYSDYSDDYLYYRDIFGVPYLTK